MSEFYREIGARVLAFCEERLRPWAEREFERCEDPKKRFHFPSFFYRLETRTCEEGGVLSVSMRATLGRRGIQEPLRQWERVLTWSAQEDCLLPPCKRKKEKGKIDEQITD